MKWSESEESDNEVEPMTSTSCITEKRLVNYEEISALAIPPDGSLYCVGNEEGIVEIVDTTTQRSIELMRFRSCLEVDLLAWSEDANHVAAADVAGDLVVKHLMPQNSSGSDVDFKAETLINTSIDLDGIGPQQLLFSYDSSLLLVMRGNEGVVWNVEDSTIKTSVKLTENNNRVWLKHPSQEHLLLGFGIDDVKLFQWLDFTEQFTLHYQHYPELDDQFNSEMDLDCTKSKLKDHNKTLMNSEVDKAFLTQDEKHILVQIKDTLVQGKTTKRLLIFDSSSFEITKEKFITTATYPTITSDVLATITMPLGILTGSRLVFLDKDM